MTDESRSWTVRVDGLLSFTEPSVVRFRGVLYPATGEAVWTRDDGLTIKVLWRVDPKHGAQATNYSVTAPEGEALATSDTRWPVASIARYAAEDCAILQQGEEGPVSALVRPGEKGPLSAVPRPVRTDRARLEHVATLYREAVAAGEAVAQHVGEHLEVPVGRRRAEELIAQARREGLIESSPPGRKPKPKGGARWPGVT